MYLMMLVHSRQWTADGLQGGPGWNGEQDASPAPGLFNPAPVVLVRVLPTHAHITSLGQGQQLPKWKKETFPVSLTTFSAVWHLQRKQCA